MKRRRLNRKPKPALSYQEKIAQLRLKRGKKPARYGLGARTPLKAGRKTKEWAAERRKLKADSARNGRTTCELRGVIPHECTYDDQLGYAHPAKRRKLEDGEISVAILVCNTIHDQLEKMPPAEMKRIVYDTIAARQKAA